MPLILFKAVIPGGAGTDLFAAPVEVDGYVTKVGTYVAPHHATRRKKLVAPLAPRQASLFDAPPAPPRPEPAPKPVQPSLLDAPGPSPDAGAATAAPDTPPPAASPSPPAAKQPAPPAPAKAPRQAKPRKPAGTPEAAQPSAPAAITWGVPAGTGKDQRRAWNREASTLVERLEAEGRAPTDEERQILCRYSGTGNIGASLNEYYTDPGVAATMWAMLRGAGWQGGEVLEPSCGAGVFLHTAPAAAKVVGVELDPTSSRIARILHPQHEVATGALEQFATTDRRRFSAVIGNVPFGLRGAWVSEDKGHLGKAETYFVDTALDKAADGALVALIVPTGVMDAAGNRPFREAMLRKGEFLGAHRLPNTAFAAAHTKVTTDIILLRKRPQEVAGALGAADEATAEALGVRDAEVIAGTYFQGRGAPNVYGAMRHDGGRFGTSVDVSGSMAGVADALAAAAPPGTPGGPATLAAVLAATGDEAARERMRGAAASPPYADAPKDGDTKEEDGHTYILRRGRWHRLDPDLPAAVAAALDAHAAVRAALAPGASALDRARAQEALDALTAAHGVPGENRDIRRWLAAPFLTEEHYAKVPPAEALQGRPATLQAARGAVLDVLAAVNADGTHSDAIAGRGREAPAASLDSIATAFALSDGGFTVEELAHRTGRPVPEVLDHLHASPDYAQEPQTGRWTTMDQYLSGDLWEKVDAARAALAGAAPEYRDLYARQEQRLLAAIAPLSLDDVEVDLHSGFVPPGALAAWQREEAEAKGYSQHFGNPRITYFANDDFWKVAGCADNKLLAKALNRRNIRDEERDQVADLHERFRDWLVSSPFRAEAEERYNRQYRGFAPRVFGNAPIETPGLNPAFKVNDYQWGGVRWALAAGKGIIAADVGVGKTTRGLLLAAIGRATGKWKKPAFVVPKSVLANWVRSTETMFPDARIMVVGATFTKGPDGELKGRDDTEADRARKLREVQQNDYDFIIFSRPAYEKVPVSEDRRAGYLAETIGERVEGKGERAANEIATAAAQADAARRFDGTERGLAFDDLGIDGLILDEAHAYKNLVAKARSRFGGDTPKFLGVTSTSKTAYDTFLKTRAVRERNGGMNVYLMTATPTKNSPLEVYSMLSHIEPEYFKKMGIRSADDFVSRFVETRSGEYLDAKGRWDEGELTSGFKNLDEIRQVMRRFIDRTTAADVGLKLPEPEFRENVVEMDDRQREHYELLRRRAESLAAGNKEDNMLSIMDGMQKAAIDAGLADAAVGARPHLKGTPASPKVKALVANVAAGLKDGAQVIFCDYVAMHDKIRDELVKAGVPREKIGVLNADETADAAKRLKVADDLNSGKLDVVIGNTAVAGEGVNLQVRTTDMHHMDIPWEPASVQQRNGRGLRQGNTNDSIRIHSYLTKQSFDGYRWQMTLAKRSWQDLLWNGGDRIENPAVANLGSDERLIMMSADPDEMRKRLESSKEARQQQKAAQDRQRAGVLFSRWQKDSQTLARLERRGGDPDIIARLRTEVDTRRKRLENDDAFPRHLLGTDAAFSAFFDSRLGQLWQEGVEFTHTATGVPVRMEVVEVNARTGGEVVAQPVDGGERMRFKLTSLPRTALRTPSPEERRAQALARVKEHIGNKTLDGAHRLRGMHPEDVAAHADDIQAALREAAADRRLAAGWGTNHLMERKDGLVRLVSGTDARARVMAGDSFVLPDAGLAERAGRALHGMAMHRHLTTYYGGRSTQSQDMVQVGTNPERGSYAETQRHLREVHGARVAEEADAHAHRLALEAIAAAPDFQSAYKAAESRVKPDAGLVVHIAPQDWPRDVRAALARAAERHGIMESPLADAASGRATYGVPAAARAGASYLGHSVTVGRWLEMLRDKTGDGQ